MSEATAQMPASQTASVLPQRTLWLGNHEPEQQDLMVTLFHHQREQQTGISPQMLMLVLVTSDQQTGVES